MKKRNADDQLMTPQELSAKVDAYFAECEALDVFPDRATMIVRLGLPVQVYRRLENNADDKYALYADILLNARLRREGWLSRAMFSDKNKAQSAIFQLRQPYNGGYSDKQEDSGTMTVRLMIGGGDRKLLE